MGIIIQSGGTTPNAAQVDGGGRLLTRSIANTNLYVEAESGRSYYVTTEGFINVTDTTNYSGLLYIKNTSPGNHIHIHELRESALDQTKFKIIKNPTAGTLISGGSDLIPPNLLFSSGQQLDADVKLGSSGSTVTDGDHVSQWEQQNAFSLFLDGGIVLMPGNSMAIMAKPTVATDVGISILLYSHEHPLP